MLQPQNLQGEQLYVTWVFTEISPSFHLIDIIGRACQIIVRERKCQEWAWQSGNTSGQAVIVESQILEIDQIR